MTTLELNNVTKIFGGVRAVDRISLGFEQGKVTALIGPNGAGKTTVFNLINGFIRPDEGAITFKGKNLVGLKPWEIAQLGIGRLFQDVRLFQRLKVVDNVMAAFNRYNREGVLFSLIMPWKVAVQERKLRERALALLEFVGLAGDAEKLADNLSYGQQKLLAIVRLLANDSNVLLLDEPTAGVNPLMLKSILEVIRKLGREGKTVVVIEHNLNVIIEVADWVYFMSNGQITSFGLPQDVLGDPEVRRTYIGI